MSDLVKKYFQGIYSRDVSVFKVLSVQLEGHQLSSKELSSLEKLLQVFFLGQLIGLPTLRSILVQCGIGSNKWQLSYRNICKKLSINKIRELFEGVFAHQLSKELSSKATKDSSCWSRELTTVIIDDSIFRCWLSAQDKWEDLEECYGKFYSGQFGSVVYGFRVVSLGVSIEGVFYPLFFDFVKKKTAKNYKKAKEVAGHLVERWGKWKESLGVTLPKLHFSCDHGYSDAGLAKTCEQNGLCYISVPKKSHYFEFEDMKIKLSDWIEKVFIPQEKEHIQQQEMLSEKDKKAFTVRIKAKYCCKNQDVTLLAFRLNGSKKVSVIYSFDKSIFSKTLRRHWFQRTYIEQFFKTLKHVLQIQEARTNDKQGFEIKLLRFTFVALHVQKLIKFLRKKIKEFTKQGFISIQRMLRSQNGVLELLQEHLE